MPILMKSFLKRHKLSKKEIVFAAVALVAIVAMVSAVAAANGFYAGSWAKMIDDASNPGAGSSVCSNGDFRCVSGGKRSQKCIKGQWNDNGICTNGCSGGKCIAGGSKTGQPSPKPTLTPTELCRTKYPGSTGITYSASCSKYSSSATYVWAGDVDLSTNLNNNVFDTTQRATCCYKREEYNKINTTDKCPVGSYCEFNVKAKTKIHGAKTLESTYNTDCSMYTDAKRPIIGTPYQKLISGRCLSTGVLIDPK